MVWSFFKSKRKKLEQVALLRRELVICPSLTRKLEQKGKHSPKNQGQKVKISRVNLQSFWQER